MHLVLESPAYRIRKKEMVGCMEGDHVSEDALVSLSDQFGLQFKMNRHEVKMLPVFSYLTTTVFL